MDIMSLIDLIPSLGFPIVCVIGMGCFIFYIFKVMNEQNSTTMTQVQERCQKREDKLYDEITEGRQINGQFAELIGKYDSKLDDIKDDVRDIKEDVTAIKAKTDI